MVTGSDDHEASSPASRFSKMSHLPGSYAGNWRSASQERPVDSPSPPSSEQSEATNFQFRAGTPTWARELQQLREENQVQITP